MLQLFAKFKLLLSILAAVVILFILIPQIITRTSYDQQSTLITSIVMNVLSNIAIFGIPLYYILFTGKFKNGFFLCWFLQFLLGLCFIHYSAVITSWHQKNNLL